MEEDSQSFDICIVCALYEEARAVIDEFSARCGVTFTRAFRGLNQWEYRHATIQNRRGESLTVFVTWLSRMGPIRTALDLAPLFHEIRPRFAAMTGVCAGDRRKVKRGDLIVAIDAYHPEEGKITKGTNGQPVHLSETRTAGATTQVIQYVQGFDDWKVSVRDLKRQQLGRAWKTTGEPQCHIDVMASSMAVHADNPFPQWTTQYHRKTVGIDMEAATFYTALRDFPLMHGLVVKGVSDYGDSTKSDRYRDIARRASAVYLLHFIQEYVTDETMPRRDVPSAEGRAGSSGVWTVPYRRNPYFTGRDEVLKRLNQHLSSERQDDPTTMRRAALTQPQALTGLGGIGKTQIAVEYAYRSHDLGRYTHTLWVNAANQESILASFVEIAAKLPAFPAKTETNQRKLIEAVKHWLEQCQQSWLLIVDNVDHDDDLPAIREYLPQRGNGSVLLTTRASAVGSLATPVEVETMGFVEGAWLLLRRAQQVHHALNLEKVSEEEADKLHRAGNIVQALDHFPLALDQAGAYIEETQCSFEDYLDLYQTHRQQLLAERGKLATEYPDSVATTWSLSFQKVEQQSPAAAELLRLCAFLAPDRIPEELITDAAAYWPTLLQQAAADPFTFQQMIKQLLNYSLMKRLAEDRALSVHRLVQAVQKDQMEEETQRRWAERVIRAINEVFPENLEDVTTWPQCLRYLDQAQACSSLINDYEFAFIEAASILSRTSIYLDAHALYSIAEPLYQHALALCEQVVGPDHPDTANCLNNLAALYRRQGRYAEAEPLYQRALAIYEQQGGSGHPDIAGSLNNLALLYTRQGKYEQAEPLYQRALAISEQQLGPDHPHIAGSLNNLALLYTRQGKYEQAEPLYQRALAIREQQLGPDHPHIATSLSNLAALYQRQGKYEQAEPLNQRALIIRERQLGPDHPDTAYTLNNLAQVYEKQGKYEQAEPLYQRVLAIRERQLGPDHPDTASSLNILAAYYQGQGKYEQAEPLFQRALAIREQQLGPDHPDTATSFNNLATLYQKQGKFDQAEPLFQRALIIYEQQLGTNHPRTCAVRKNHADLLQTMRRDA